MNQAEPRPLVGLSANIFRADPTRRAYKGKRLHYVDEQFAAALLRAGASPVLIPAVGERDALAAVIDRLDGLVLTGGADVHPASYGEPEAADAWPGDHVRDAHELALLELADARDLPVLAVCRGVQVLNVSRGGTLYQDLPSQRPGPVAHRDRARYDHLLHQVRVDPGSWVHGVYGRDSLLVNSVHHQAIKRVGDGLRATAWAPDGLVEGVEWAGDDRFLVGVQWHPEWLDPEMLASVQQQSADAAKTPSAGDSLFAAFVEALRTPQPRRLD